MDQMKLCLFFLTGAMALAAVARAGEPPAYAPGETLPPGAGEPVSPPRDLDPALAMKAIGKLSRDARGQLQGIVVRNGGEAVFAWSDLRGASIYRLSGTEAVLAYAWGSHVTGITFDGAVVYVTAGRPKAQAGGHGLVHRLLVSRDFGRTWQAQGDLPMQWPTQMVAAALGELWVQDRGALWCSADGGETWQTVPAPGVRDASEERLDVTSGALRILGDGFIAERVARDRENHVNRCDARFTVRSFPGLKIALADKDIIVAQAEKVIRIGRLSEKSVSWFKRFDNKDAAPHQLRVDGKVIRLLLRPHGEEDGPDKLGSGLQLYASRDGGTHWQGVHVPALFLEDVGFAPDGSARVIDERGNIFALPPLGRR